MNIHKIKSLNGTTDAFFLFLTGSVIGWLYEVSLHLFQDGTFVNRGILHGPWLPIYGVGCVLLVFVYQFFGNKPLRFFIVSTVACGLLEYLTSWATETIYHTRWWDYSDLPLNVNGRIFLGGLLGFSAAGCVFVYLLLPTLEKCFHRIPTKVKKWCVTALVVIFISDVVLSMVSPNMGAGITT